MFSQGGTGDSVFYIQKGRVRIAVVSKRGKEATLALLGPGDFIGEDCIGFGQKRMASAIALTNCTLIKISRKDMRRAVHSEHEFSDVFVAYLMARNIRIQEDLIDQLFNSSEKRLARTLLLLANFGKNNRKPETVIPKTSQETLAEMIGTTRSRVNFFMNRFRNLGFIDNGGLKIQQLIAQHHLARIVQGQPVGIRSLDGYRFRRGGCISRGAHPVAGGPSIP